MVLLEDPLSYKSAFLVTFSSNFLAIWLVSSLYEARQISRNNS